MSLTADAERAPSGLHRAGVEFLAHILGKEAQHEVAVLLKQLVSPSIAAIRDRIREVLSAIEFDG